MKGFLDTVQKRIGILISILGIVVVVLNIIVRIQLGQNLFTMDAAMSVWFVLLITIPYIFSAIVENTALKILQIAGFFAMGMINVIDAYQEFYGPAMFLAAWLLMRHYGFLEKHAVIKNSAVLFLLISLSQLSAYLHSDGQFYAGFTTLIFTMFLVYLLVIIWRDMIRMQEELKKENRSLKMDYNQLSELLEELEEEQKPYDFKAAKISPAEKRVIEALTIYKASNREIAERLNLAESTVKLHLYNIYNKIGVDNRFAIIDLCKYNFIDKKSS